jgi:class 3 adenylate cyclase
MSGGTASARAPRRTVSFEVAVRRQRRWEVLATYQAYERESALEDARSLEKEPGVDGTKVTKETWRHDTNRVDTAVIYRSRALEEEMIELAAARPKPAPPPPGLGARLAVRMSSALGASAEPDGHRNEAYVPAVSVDRVVADVPMTRVLPWIMLSFVGACGLGVGAAVAASMLMQTAVDDGMWLSRQEQSGILISVFLGVTGLTFVIALRRILSRFARLRRERARRDARTLPETGGRAADGAPAGDTETLGDDAGNPVADAEAGEELPADPAPDETSSEAARVETPFAAQLQAFEGALRGRLRDRLDAFDASQRFALNVYIAGAVERLAQPTGADRESRRKLVTAPLIRLGTPPDIAARFGQSLDEHLTRPRALDVYNRGRDAAARFADSDEDAIDPLSAIAAWDAPDAGSGMPQNDIVAIMFTDIVESTARTHAVGDEASQAILRAHNAIVRDVLGRCDGTEIKHTGDGIMASFAIATRAVEAARMIQRNTEAFGRSDPAMAFDLRIGINVGEPVRENDDLFGAAVQLASRLCGTGKSGQTIVSRVVCDLCTGKGYTFDSLGSVELRGIPGQTELYALRWREPAVAAAE